MSKWNQIQNRLSEIEGGLFQQIGDAYLRSKYGFVGMNRRGAMIGTDKTISGTPDAVFDLPDGRHVFVQYTTRSDRLKTKLNDDLRECFDSSTTAIPTDKVEEVILCHNSRSDAISEEDKLQLRQVAAQYGWRLSIVDVEELAWALWREYPWIAKESLGIAVDTGQMLDIDEFVRQYDGSSAASPLDVEFCLREEELQIALEQLEARNLLVLTGAPGVGKTRFALECCRRFVEAHTSFHIKCIYFKGPSVYEDIIAELSPSGDYLLFVDDFNRVSDRQFIVNLLREQRADRRVKLILTVREYALKSVVDLARGFPGSDPFGLNPLSSDQIRQLVKTSHGIMNPHAQDRIVEIAKGNARLAVMAAHIALTHGTLKAIVDAAGLYEEYFASLRRDGHALADQQHLIVAGLMAMLRVVNLDDEEFIQRVVTISGITNDGLARSIQALHDAEVVDLYENEIAKVSDQVLATYLVYRVFFRDHLLDLSIVLLAFFFHRPKAAADGLYPVLSTFQSQATFNEVGKAIDQIWEHIAEDEGRVLSFLAAFWFVHPNMTLQHVAEKIQDTEPLHLPSQDLRFEDTRPSETDPLLAILEAFRGAEFVDYRIAAQILIEYGHRRNDRLPAISMILAKSFGFQFESYLQDYRRQSTVVELLVNKIKDKTDPVDVGLFIQVAKQYLRGEHSAGHMEDGSRYAWREFVLQSLPSLVQLRNTIWRQLFALVELPQHYPQAITIVQDYIRLNFRSQFSQIVQDDTEVLVPLIQNHLSPNSYLHCQIVHNYFEGLDELGITIDAAIRAAIRAEFDHPALDLAQSLKLGWPRRTGSTYEEYEHQCQERLSALLAQLDGSDWPSFFALCHDILVVADSHYAYQIRERVVRLLWMLAEERPTDFPQVVSEYLAAGDLLDLYPFGVVFKLIELSGANLALATIRQTHIDWREKWLLAFYANLPGNEVLPEHWAELQQLYHTAPVAVIPHKFDYIANFCGQDQDALVKITRILLERAGNSEVAYLLERLMPHNAETRAAIRTAFGAFPTVLIEAYLFVRQHVQHADHDAETFSLILDLDSSFGSQYVQWQWLQQHGDKHVYFDHHDYTALWRREDCAQVMDRILDTVQGLPKPRYISQYDYFKPFFVPPNPQQHQDPEIEERLVEYLESLITRYPKDMSLMTCVFDIAAEALPIHCRQLMTRFLEYNQNVEEFRSLPLFQLSGTAWGSIVSVFDEKIKFLQSLLPLMNDLRYLGHRGVIEQQIDFWRRQIESERRREFADSEW